MIVQFPVGWTRKPKAGTVFLCFGLTATMCVAESVPVVATRTGVSRLYHFSVAYARCNSSRVDIKPISAPISSVADGSFTVTSNTTKKDAHLTRIQNKNCIGTVIVP